MRVPAVILAFLLGLFVGQGIAGAEKVKTNQSTKLYNRPGEQARVLLKVKTGTSMTLLAKDGRWLKVRVKGRTGYVPRSKVDMADDGDIARNTRRRPFVDGRGKRRGETDGAPDDRVGADALGDTSSEDSGNDSGDDSGDDEEDDEKPAKVASKPSSKSKTSTKARAHESDDDDDEEEDRPAKAAPVKTAAKPAAKSSDDGDDDEDEDEEEEEDDTPAAKVAVRSSGDEDEDDDEDGDSTSAKSDKTEDSRPTARVTKRVSVHTEPDDDSDEDFVVRPSDTLFVGDTKGDWTYVENSAGDGGWVQNDLLEEGAAGGGTKRIQVRARAGLLAFQQTVRSTASAVQTPPDNYDVKSRMLSINLGGGIVIPRGKLLYGGELTYDLAKGSAPYEGFPDTSLTVHNVNVRALVGLDFKKASGMALLGHLGYRYQGILVGDVANEMANPARLPSEVVKGPAIGAALDIPRLRPKLGLNVSLDAMLFGASITQTKGLEDGASPSLKAIVLGAGLAYHLSSLDVLARYELDYMSVDFGAPLATSTRMHMGTGLKRTDTFHGVTVGISKPF
jgi:uncharacterized protein YgiM (DUF1202 family)